MTDRSEIPMTNEHFARWCGDMVGQPYWYGTCVYRATETLLRKKQARYPAHYGAGRLKKYRRDIAARRVVADCVGACKGYAWTDGGQGVLASVGTGSAYRTRYRSNGCPDKGADSLFRWAKAQGAAWGDIATLPDVPGLALYKAGHLGYTTGGGEAVEWRGYRYGCVRTAIADRPWTHWFALPFLDYGGQVRPRSVPLGARTLRRGDSGSDVRTLQERLNARGAALAEDGRYGAKTEAAVQAFQQAAGLRADGVCGPRTYAALEKAQQEEKDA